MSPIISRVSSSQGINSLSGFRRAFLGRSGVPAGYQIERSVRLNEADSPYLTRTPSSASNTRVFTFSAWVKRSGPGTQNLQALFAAGSGASDNDYFQILFGGDQFRISALNYTPRRTYALYRDYSAWLHVLVHVDLNQASNSNKYRAWINNEEVAWQDTSSNQTNTGANTTTAHYIGAEAPGARRSNCYLTEVHFVDGQALDPSIFGEFDANGIWQPIEYTGTYGTNGFYLPCSDNSSASALGTDYSGNSNNWSVNNISVAAGAGNDSLRDSPTNGGTANDTGAGGQIPGNYVTLNPLYFYISNASQNDKWSLSNGNLQVSWDSTGSFDQWIGTTFGNFPSSGKYYAEVTMISIGSGGIFRHGILNPALSGTYITNGYFLIDGNASAGTVLGFAWDIDNQIVTIYKNNTQLLQQTGIDIAGYAPTWLGSNSNSRDWTAAFNFGQRPFAYAAPSGFKAL